MIILRVSTEEFMASVIVPVRNASSVITEQLDALRDQSFRNCFHILVVDDNSSDDTAEIVEEWIEQHPEISIELIQRHQRGGPNASRNEGIHVARAPFLLFCDGDDIVDSKWIEALVGAADDWVLLGGVVKPFANFPIKRWPKESRYPRDFGFDFAYGGNLAMSAALARNLNGFDEAILYEGIEVEFAIRAQLSGVNLRLVSMAIVNYRLPNKAPKLFSREFRKERGRAYRYREFSGQVDSSRDLRHFLYA